MFKDKITVVVGLDAVTLRQWAVSIPTVRKHRPDIIDLPWIIFYDWRQIEASDISKVVRDNGFCHSVRLVPWPPCEIYGSQREKMLTGFVFIPMLIDIRTNWWMKIDADAIALHAKKPWCEPSWFNGNVLVAPRWGYTKVKGDNRSAAEWADSLETFGDAAFGTPRLNLAAKVNGNKIVKSRICSWVSFYRTDWATRVAKLANDILGEHRLPVSSQDTFHWYCAAREDMPYLRTSMKRRGWTNVPRFEKLKQVAARSLTGAD